MEKNVSVWYRTATWVTHDEVSLPSHEWPWTIEKYLPRSPNTRFSVRLRRPRTPSGATFISSRCFNDLSLLISVSWVWKFISHSRCKICRERARSPLIIIPGNSHMSPNPIVNSWRFIFFSQQSVPFCNCLCCSIRASCSRESFLACSIFLQNRIPLKYEKTSKDLLPKINSVP